MTPDYSKLEGYQPEADLGLGCGLPTQFAKLASGETVVDLGSGAGNDVFVARRLVGESGHVIGVDMTEAMIARANANKASLGYKNVEFRLGEIEALPVDENKADVVISNCVLNLVPDKKAAFSEIYRVLKPGGRFSISDIVLSGMLPEKLRSAVALYVGCIAGASQTEEYLGYITGAGFVDVQIPSKHRIHITPDMLTKYAEPAEIEQFMGAGIEVLSVTVTGRKPKA